MEGSDEKRFWVNARITLWGWTESPPANLFAVPQRTPMGIGIAPKSKICRFDHKTKTKTVLAAQDFLSDCRSWSPFPLRKVDDNTSMRHVKIQYQG
jgi:hypothetical protein